MESRSKLWYGNDKALDDHIKELFGQDLEDAILERNLHWAENPTGALALVILLDQFSRNIFRGTSKAFEQDAFARAIAYRAVNNGFEQDLSVPERLFLYHPFHHSELLDDQDFGIKLVHELIDEVAEEWQKACEESMVWFKSHRDIVAKYGRFPHRNQILGRQSSTDELEYLKSASTLGQ